MTIEGSRGYRALFISEDTVKRHMKQIMPKLGLVIEPTRALTIAAHRGITRL